MSIQHLTDILNENLENLYVGDITCKSITSITPPAFVNITCNTLNSNSVINSGNIATATMSVNTITGNNILTTGITTDNLTATSLATLDSVLIGTGNTPGRALTQQNGNIQTFEVPSSAYLVNQGQKIISNTLSSTTILKSLISPTIGTTYNSTVSEGDQFRLCAEGSYACSGACDFTFGASLYNSSIISVMFISLAGLLAPSNWFIDITYTVVSISGTQVVISQSGGLTTTNASVGPNMDYYAINGQTSYITPIPSIPDPNITLTMTTAVGTVVAYNASFSRIFRY
jgi:hypothetical protein